MKTSAHALPAPGTCSSDLRESVKVTKWTAVAGRTVYFGHQSVGRDIIAGIVRLNEEHQVGLRVVHTSDPTSIDAPAFVHFRAGNNRDYASKNAALLRLLNARSHPDGAIVLLKYCYVDILLRADSDVLFAAYAEMVETINFEHPDVTVVHATIPLTTVEGLFLAGARRFLGRPTLREAAAARHRYNELMRAAFSGDHSLFDLARIESMAPNGARATFRVAATAVETLARPNTTDGGHLSAACQQAAASALLDVLALAIMKSRARVV